MCIRDRVQQGRVSQTLDNHEKQLSKNNTQKKTKITENHQACLLYTSDAADERSSVDLGGRRIIKKKTNT